MSKTKAAKPAKPAKGAGNRTSDVRIRALTELDVTAVVKIDEKVGGRYRPEEWDTRIAYYLRRDPDAPKVAEIDGKVVGFMLGEIRSGEFGLDEPTGWIEVLGVDPGHQGKSIGRKLADAMLAYFKERGARNVRTLVDEGMKGIGQFFEAVGFKPGRVRLLERAL